jgi:hypothetical protein
MTLSPHRNTAAGSPARSFAADLLGDCHVDTAAAPTPRPHGGLLPRRPDPGGREPGPTAPLGGAPTAKPLGPAWHHPDEGHLYLKKTSVVILHSGSAFCSSFLPASVT